MPALNPPYRTWLCGEVEKMRRTTVFGLSVAGLVLSMVAASAIANAFAGQTTRVSVSSTRVPANASALSGVISANGRFVVFHSGASNLVNGVSGTHVYRHDRATGATVLVDLAASGFASTGPSLRPTISADGRYVAFDSFASDLVAGDTNGVMDVFVRDMQTASSVLVSANADGVPGDLSSNLSGQSGAHEISDDGRYVAFLSSATNLVPQSNNGVQQVYVKDLTTGQVVRASVNDAGEAGNSTSQSPSLSGNGQFVAFGSASTNLSPLSNNFQVFVRDLAGGTTTLETQAAAAVGRASTLPALSSDGRYVAFESTARLDVRDLDNGTPDVFLRDRVTGITVLASLSTNSVSGANSSSPSISGDGRWVAFHSLDDKLVPVDTNGMIDVFLYDRTTQAVTLVSLNDAEEQANMPAVGASVSFDGGLVLFGSTASNLVAGTQGSGNQLYVRNLVSNRAPVVDAGPDETVNEGQWLRRFGSFTDADGSTSWTGTFDYGAGAMPLGIDPVKKMWSFQHEPLAPGEYTVTLSMTDDAGATGTDTFTHTVRNIAPSIQGLSDETIYFGSTFRRNVYIADPGQSWPVPQPAETYTATVNYGDGTGTTALSGTYFTLEHTYANAGTYVVTMTATDSNGGTSTASMTLHVLSYRFDWLVDGFVVGRNQPVKFTVHAADGAFILDQNVWVDVVDVYGNVVLAPYRFGDQPSRAITASSDAYHVNVDTKGFEPGSYRLRVHFASPTLVGEFSLSSAGAAATVRSRSLR